MATFRKKFGFNTPVRLSYCHLDKPYANTSFNQEPRYSARILIPKTDKQTAKLFKAACGEVYENTKGMDEYEFEELFTAMFRDGDKTAPKGKKYSNECHGCWVIGNAWNSRRPVYQYKDGTEMLDPSDELYSGSWAKVGVTIYGYVKAGNVGFGLGLDVIRKAKDDERLAGGVNVEDYDFTDDDDDDI